MYSNNPSNEPVETAPSALTCHHCKNPILYHRIDENSWWLEVPCVKCGSWLFDVRIDHPRCHMQIFGVSA